jgi:photosystem II stability/assembly factor-like uncharacterized protein
MLRDRLAFIFVIAFPGLAAAATAPVIFESTSPGEFVAHVPGSRVTFDHSGFTLQTASQPVRVRFEGSSHAARLDGSDPLPGGVNRFQGNDPSAWKSHIPAFGRLRYRDVYPGIDVVFYQDHSNLEFDFVVAAGADPRRISLAIEGARVQPASDGDLKIGPVRLHRPSIYQESAGGARQNISGDFRLSGAHRLRFALDRYDRSRPLVIDPEILFSTYIAGTGMDTPLGMATDPQGNVYVTGQTTSRQFPVKNALQPSPDGNGQIFVQKYSADGSQLIFSTYLGGSGDDSANRIVLDAAGNIYLGATLESHDFPTVRPIQSVKGSNSAAAVVMLSPDGSKILFSTYLGGGDNTFNGGLAVDSAGMIYITGMTESADFPATTILYHGNPGFRVNLYIAKIDPVTPKLIYSTIAAPGDGVSLTIDSQGNAIVGGETLAADFPIVGGPAFTCPSFDCNGGFVLKLNATGDQILYSLRTGSNVTSTVQSVVADSSGNVFITGQALGAGYPVTAGAFQTRPGGGILFHDSDAGGAWSRLDLGIPSSAVQALAANPLQISTILAGTPDGLFRSDDGAQTWRAVLTGQSIIAVAFDTMIPSNVYAGTTAGFLRSTDGGLTFSASNQGLGISPALPAINRFYQPRGGTPGTIYAATNGGPAVSSDGGATWSYIGKSSSTGPASAVYVDPANTNTILAAGGYDCVFSFLRGCTPQGGLLRSADGGATFKNVLGAGVTDIVADSFNPATLYAASPNGLYVSNDSGVTWAFPPSTIPILPLRLALDPFDPRILYALVSKFDGYSSTMVLASTDGGRTWAEVIAEFLPSPGNDLLVVAGDYTRFYIGGSLLGDCYITKLDPNGQILATTFFGGSGMDQPFGLQLDAAGNLYVVGSTASVDLPLRIAIQASLAGSINAFVAKFSGDLTQLSFSTYLGGSGNPTYQGGSGNDVARAVALGPSGAVYVIGTTTSSDFPVKNALQPPPPPVYGTMSHGFLVKLSPAQ